MDRRKTDRRKADARRRPRPFDNHDDSFEDARARGNCLVIDTAGQFWSMPMELTIHDLAEAVAMYRNAAA